MPTPTSRLLALLELLQSRPSITGREIAVRLGVDARTVRRYMNALEDLGIPIEGQRGVGGGYRVRPGFRLPPLMLDDDEAVAVSLGLLTTSRLGLAAEDAAVGRALDKVHRVLPDTIRRRIEALETTVAFASPPPTGRPIRGDTALLLADAIHRRRRLRLAYVSFAGERSERLLSPYGLVIHGARWYVVAYDHGRADLRTFRADRCSEIVIANGAPQPPPDGLDAVDVVSRSFARVPRRWEALVLLDLPLEAAAARLPATLAELAPVDGGTRVRMRVDSLDWTAAVLAGLGCDFAVERPRELVEAVRRVADRLRRMSA